MVVRATKRFLDRVRASTVSEGESSGVLGDWYVNVLRWRRPVALFVNERTLLPVVVGLAPAASVIDRVPPLFAALSHQLGADAGATDREVATMRDYVLAKTANRSVVGVVNEFGRLADDYRATRDVVDLTELSRWLAQTPCSPLYGGHISPDRALRSLL
jgi:hypothetical protein